MFLNAMFGAMRRLFILFLAAGFILAAGQGSRVSAAEAKPDETDIAQANDSVNDPLETMNRGIFAFNEVFQDVLLRPVASFYKAVFPEMVRDGIHNALSNLRSPVVLANDLLQGEGGRAVITTERLVINSVAGLGGLIDVAEKMGIKGHSEDLGQTLAVWGVGEGFYLVLPILGPSNPRDGLAKLGDHYLDPVSLWADNTDRDEIGWTRTLLGGVDTYSLVMDDIEKLKETSIDYYAAVRSITRQRRQAEIMNGTADGAPLPDIRYDFNAGLSAN